VQDIDPFTFPTTFAGPGVTFLNGVPYITWSDGNTIAQTFVAHWVPDPPAPTLTPTPPITITPVPGLGRAADIVIGQPDMVHNLANQGNEAGMNTLNDPESIDCKNGQFFIADCQNKRALIFNHIPSTNNADADVVVGLPSILGWCRGVAGDGHRLYVDFADHDSTGSMIMRYNQIPEHPGTQADQLLTMLTYSQSVFCDGDRFYTFGATDGLFIYNANTLSFVRCSQLDPNCESVTGDGVRLFLAARERIRS
jgi:hypothetical protein